MTVTTRTKDYAFVLHSKGMLNLKFSEMTPELREQLGYTVKKESTNSWTKQAMAAVEAPAVKEVEKQVSNTLQRYGAVPPRFDTKSWNSNFFIMIGGVVLAMYLFWSYCFHLICAKAGKPGGLLVWIPVLQLIPLLRAAGMSGWWFLGFMVPVVNLIAQILWSLKITEARGKSVFWGIMLILPLTNLFALLYLAFSAGPDDGRSKKKDQKIQLMTPQPA